MDLSTYIPAEIIGGYKRKKDNDSNIFLTYKKPEGTYRNHQAFENWRDHLIELSTFDNTPISGFQILNYVGGLGRDSRMVKVQIRDPRNFVVECKLDNILDIIKKYGYSPDHGFNTSLCYKWDEYGGLTLCPMTTDEFNKYQEDMQSLHTLSLNELEPLKYYKSKHYQYTGYYLGQFKIPFLSDGTPDTYVNNKTHYSIKVSYLSHHVFLYKSQYSSGYSLNVFKTCNQEFIEDIPEKEFTHDELQERITNFIKSNITYQGEIIQKGCKEFTEFFIPSDYAYQRDINTCFLLSPDKTLLMKWMGVGQYGLAYIYEIIDGTIYCKGVDATCQSFYTLEELLEKYKDYTEYQVMKSNNLYIKGKDGICYKAYNFEF